MKVFLTFSSIIIFLGCGCANVDQHGQLSSNQFIEVLKEAKLKCDITPRDSQLDLLTALEPKEPIGIYLGQEFSFALFEDANLKINDFNDLNDSLVLIQNHNLILSGKGLNAKPYVEVFESLRPPLTVHQLGFFIYPLGICLLLAIFVTCERFYSLRGGLTFPRKVAKALQSGEFPNTKWKKRSAAERIVWVATKENPSADTLRSYARLEITSMERGLFLLEVVVSAAPLIGLLGTVTGLVKVFSQIPAGGGVGDTAVFSEGIAMALLTTIAGLAIAIPTLISHSYLVRLIEKRTSSISWLTERLVDAIYHKDENNYREIS